MATHLPGLFYTFHFWDVKWIVFFHLCKLHLYYQMEMAKCKITAFNLSYGIIPESTRGAVHLSVTLGYPQVTEGSSLSRQKIKPAVVMLGWQHKEKFQECYIWTTRVCVFRRGPTAAQHELYLKTPNYYLLRCMGAAFSSETATILIAMRTSHALHSTQKLVDVCLFNCADILNFVK